MSFEPLSGRIFPRYSGIKTFFRLPFVEKDSEYDVALVGVPYDGGTSYRSGSRFGPQHVRATSSLGRGYSWSRADYLWSKKRFADIGDCPVVPLSQEKTYQQIENFYGDLMGANKKVISVGGDHSTTLPILRALSTKHGPLSLIHFDAHLDTYPAAWDCEYHHGTFVRHAVEEGLINPQQTLQIGLRGPLASADDLTFVKKHGIRFTTVDDLRQKGLSDFIKSLPEFSGPTYISFDVDCLDPVYAPGTGTPVPGGLTTYETQNILRGLKVKHLVAADVVEVSPPYDVAELTALAAVDTMFELMFMAAQGK